jgi:Ner family transcriptional regulator
MSKNKEENISIRTWVKFRLGLKGYTLKSFAQQHRIKSGTLGVVFYRAYPKVERLLADALEVRPWDLWPERYDPNHRPNRRNRWYDRGRCKVNRKEKNY